MLRGYVPDESHMLESSQMELQNNLSYKEELVVKMDQGEKELRNKTIPLVKVLWQNHKMKEATWETEESMRTQYPYLFY